MSVVSQHTLYLERFAYLPTGTFGQLIFPTGESFPTVECPWLDNRENVSCIPEGFYGMEKRESAVVKRSTREEFSVGWEVKNVPNRTYIMVHPGNWPVDVKGCIAVGKSFDVAPRGNSQYGVFRSRTAFREVMQLLESNDRWLLHVLAKRGLLSAIA